MSCRITLAAIALAGIAGSVQSQSCDFIDDPDTNTYSGMFGEIQNEIISRTNPYDPQVPPIILGGNDPDLDWYYYNVGEYPGSEYLDLLYMTSLNDVLLLVDPNGNNIDIGMDLIYASEGNDTIDLSDATIDHACVKVFLGDGHDVGWTSVGDDEIYGQDGDDIIASGPGNDTLLGGPDNDSLFAGDGNDLILGFLTSDSGNDLLVGGLGDDRLEDMQGSNTFQFEIGHGTDCMVIADADALSTTTIEYGDGIGVHDVRVNSVADGDAAGGCESGPAEVLTIPNGTIVVYGAGRDVTTVRFQDGRTFLISEFPSDCSADTNRDGSVTPSDFTAWVTAFNGDLPGCDQNENGLCEPSDFTMWINNYNAGCS